MVLCYSALGSLATAVPVDDFFGDYVEQLGARGLQQDVSMNGENAETLKAVLIMAMPSREEAHDVQGSLQ